MTSFNRYLFCHFRMTTSLGSLFCKPNYSVFYNPRPIKFTYGNVYERSYSPFCKKSLGKLIPVLVSQSYLKIYLKCSCAHRLYSSSSKKEKENDFLLYKELLKYIWPAQNSKMKIRVVGSMILLVGAKLLNVQVPYLFKMIIDNLNNATSYLKDSNELSATSSSSSSSNLSDLINTTNETLPSLDLWTVAGTVLVGYFLARLGSSILGEMRTVIFSNVTQSAIRTVSLQLYSHLLKLDHSFHLQRQTGSLTKNIDRGSRAITFILSSLVFNMIPTALEISLVCGLMIYYFGPVYAFITAGTMTAYSIFTFIITSWRAQFRKRMNAAENEAANRAIDCLINHEAVKIHQNEKFEVAEYNKQLLKYEEAALSTASSLALLNIGQSSIFTISLASIMAIGAAGNLSGSITIGDLVMMNGLLFQLSLPLNFLGSVYRELKQSSIDIKDLFKLLKTPCQIIDNPESKPLEFRGGKIQFKNVTFYYDDPLKKREGLEFQKSKERMIVNGATNGNGGRKIINDISFHISAGEKVAFVGVSGCGKSTITKLLYRFYDLAHESDERDGTLGISGSGTIMVDDQDIRKVTLSSLRSTIGLVPQDTPLFNRSIRYNIAYGQLGSSEEEIIEAAKNAGIHDSIIKLPQGYDTLVGERGLLLSGGEKQRIVIARLMLSPAKIIVLDEISSSLDLRTERRLWHDLLSGYCQNKTAVIIAHRLSSIADLVDRIYVLKDGTIVEKGTHRELLSIENGVYRNLWHSQEKR